MNNGNAKVGHGPEKWHIDGLSITKGSQRKDLDYSAQV